MSRSTPTPVAGTAKSEASRGPVLVLDADPAVRRVVRLVLEGAGFVCYSAANPEDARRLVTEHRPALVLADLHHGPSAEEGLRYVREAEGWQPRIALMSAYPRRSRGLEDYFIRKPIEFDRLLDLLDSIERGVAR